MTQQEKAKAYDKVSKEVKDFFEGKQKMYSDVTQTLESLFPELKESEDEKIRKNLITCISTFKHPLFSERERKEFIAWLEKQEKRKIDVEYIRTDAFIEKACDWLENLYAPNGSIAPCHVHIIEDFKNYMKGE